MDKLFSFGKWLKARRRALDLTQDELAGRVYCAGITIRKIEAGELRPSRELAELIAKELEVEPTEQHLVVRWSRG